MVTILTELQQEIEDVVKEEELIDKKWAKGLHYSEKIIQQKIDKLKEVKDGSENKVQAEPLTDTEQRIFLAAMSKEEKICKEVCADGEGVDLVSVCRSIERKVKKVLWS